MAEDNLETQVDALVARAEAEASVHYSRLFPDENLKPPTDFVSKFVTRRLDEATRTLLIEKGIEEHNEAAAEQARRITACSIDTIDTIHAMPMSLVESLCQPVPNTETRSTSCGRLGLDRLATIEEASLLQNAIDKAMVGLYHQGSSTSMAIDAMTAQRFEDSKTWQLVLELRERVRLATSSLLGTCPLFHAGGLLTRIDAIPRDGPYQINSSHVYWNAHADKANIPYYDFSALLYLASQNVQFTGGDLEFFISNSTHPRCDKALKVAPKAGRLVAFSSGFENLHRVAPVHSGTRYVLALWFTCEPALAFVEKEDLVVSSNFH